MNATLWVHQNKNIAWIYGGSTGLDEAIPDDNDANQPINSFWSLNMTSGEWVLIGLDETVGELPPEYGEGEGIIFLSFFIISISF